jgi:hypothetical protein
MSKDFIINWLKDNSTWIVAWIGLALAVWTKIELYREHRRKLEELRPWAELKADGDIIWSSHSDESEDALQHLHVTFHNTGRSPLRITDVTLVFPPDGRLGSDRDVPLTEFRIEKRVSVSWVIGVEGDLNGSAYELMLCEPASAYPRGARKRLVQFAVVCRGYEISPQKARIRIDGQTEAEI